MPKYPKIGNKTGFIESDKKTRRQSMYRRLTELLLEESETRIYRLRVGRGVYEIRV